MKGLGDPPAIEIRHEDLASPLATRLIAALDAELTALYPEVGATHFRLEPAEVAEGRGVFLVVHVDGHALACGAIRLLDADTAELKRMYVAQQARGLGLGHRLLAALETEARQLGATRLVLETGVRQQVAQALYTRAGFVPIQAYGEYEHSPLSRCFEKRF
ncbi:MAG: GNAT family N-acetyltransferase [Candidatus Sericytochromatia bacterium]